MLFRSYYKFKEQYLSAPVFDDYPYWIAHYYVDKVQYKGKWKFWQHTDVGKLYILVVNKMEQVVQTVASTIDNVEAISRVMVGKECSLYSVVPSGAAFLIRLPAAS